MQSIWKTGVGIALALAPALSAGAQATYYAGTGHYYQAFAAPNGITWSNASTAAGALGGYLSTNLSAAENTFVFGLVNSPTYWNFDGTNSEGPWIGGFQPAGSAEPAGGFQWVHGDGLLASTYTNWNPGEPNNGGAGAVSENSVDYFFLGGNGRGSAWNDLPDDPSVYGVGVRGYIVEYDTNPNVTATPEPATLALVAGGLAVLGAAVRRRRAA